jgi:hypothetical protein
MSGSKTRKYSIIILKIAGWFAAVLLILFLVVFLLLQSPRVQTYLTGKIITSLKERVDTYISVDRVAIRFPTSLGLKGVYIEDFSGDTLIYAGEIYADVGMFALLRKHVKVNRLEFSDVVANMYRIEADTIYNFQFLIDALAGEAEEIEREVEEELPVDKEQEWRVTLQRIRLNNIRYYLDDHMTGVALDLSLGNFATSLSESDLLNGIYRIGETRIAETTINLVMNEPTAPPPPDTTGMPVLDLALQRLLAEDLQFNFTSYKGITMDISAGQIEMVPRNISLHEYWIEMSLVEIDQLIADFRFPEAIETDTIPAPAPDEPFEFRWSEIMDWTASVDRFTIGKSSLSMIRGNGNGNGTAQFDAGDLTLNNITLDVAALKISPSEVRADILNTHIDFSDQFSIEQLRAEINLNSSTHINLITLQTGQSRLELLLQSSGNFLDINQQDLADYDILLEIHHGRIMSDLAWLVPVMNEYYFNWPDNQGLRFGGRIHGRLNDMIIDSLWAEAPDYLAFELSGTVAGLPVTDNLVADIPELKFLISPPRIAAHLHDTLIPEGINLPSYVILESRASGSLNNFETSTRLRTEFGHFSLEAVRENGEFFRGELFTESFDIGRLLQMQETLPQPLNLSLVAQGNIAANNGSREGEAEIRIGNLHFNNYAYQDLTFTAQLADSIISMQSVYRDDNLAYDIDAAYGMFQDKPLINGLVQLEYARLDSLGFTNQDLMIRTDIEADLVFNVEDFFNGRIMIRNSVLATGNQTVDFPPISIISDSEAHNYQLFLRSQFAHMELTSSFSPVAIPAELSHHITHYSEFHAHEDTFDRNINRRFDLYLQLIPDERITNVLLPALDNYDTLNLTAYYSDQQHLLTARLNWPRIYYGNFDLLNLQADLVGDDESLRIDLKFEEMFFSNITIYEFQTTGSLLSDSLQFDISFNDIQSQPLFAMGGHIHFTDTVSWLHLSPHNLLLNGELWNIPQTNSIAFGTGRLLIEDFLLHKDDKQISLATRNQYNEIPVVDASLLQIDLGKLTDISGTQLPALSGMVNGDFSIINIFEEPVFTAGLFIENFGVRGDTIGNITINAQNPQQDLIALVVSVDGLLTELTVEGTYQTGDAGVMNLQVLLARVDLPSFEGLTAGSLTDLEGNLAGQLTITGSPADPAISGELNFSEAAFTVAAVNAGFRLKDERILFDRQQIRLQNFRLEDQSGQQAIINGNINFSNLEMLAFNLTMNSRNFLLMDVAEGQNDMYYGHILMDSDLSIRGTQQSPIVEGRIRLNEGSGLTFSIPQAAPEAIGDEGIVEFVRLGDTLFHQTAQQHTRTKQSSFELLTANINVEVDPDTDLRIIIDEYAGDFLEVAGGGVLSFGIDPGGRITLSGRYEIESGEYLLTFYDVIRRNFRIQQGSSITWTGEPLDAHIDLTAVYNLRTSAGNLLVTHMTDDQANNPALRQQFPFHVHLRMQGDLLEPEISFEITLPDEHRNAFDGALLARLNQVNQNESELNKQVFALLILGSFIQDNPFETVGGGGFASTARSSVSQVLTQQLNQLSDRYIRGVDINFELQSSVDYTGEEETGRTELQMEVSKGFFDERVRVTVGGNIELEDENRRQTSPAEIAGDFKIEYLLNPTGNLRLMGFRTRNWTDLFDPQIYETGIALIFARSYDRFRDLFEREEEITHVDENLPGQ